MENFLYEKFQKLNLFKENKDIENGYNLFLEHNNILADYESSDYNIFIEIYKILSSNKVMNIVVKILMFFIIVLFGLSLYGIFCFIYFIIKVIFI